MPSSKPQWNEVEQELLSMLGSSTFEKCRTLPGSPVGRAYSIHLSLQSTQTSTGSAYSLSVRDGEFPDSSIIAVTDEKLLSRLRSVKGQFVCGNLPVFYYENL